MNSQNNNSHVSLAGAIARGFHFKIDEPVTAPPPAADPFKVLREEFSAKHGEATAVIELAATEKRELKPEEKTGNEQRFARLEQIKNLLDEQTKFAAMAIQGDPGAKGAVQTQKDPAGRAAFDASEGKELPAETDPFELDAAGRTRYAKEINEYGRSGELGPMSRKFATITTTSNSGILLPKTLTAPLVPVNANVFREAHTIHGVRPIQTTGTADLTIPVLDATAGGVVAENASIETENTPGLSESIRLTPKTYQSGSVWFSNQQLAANDFDLLQNVVPSLTYSKELGFESAIVAALIADAAITQNVVTATTTGFTYANLVDLNNALPKRYGFQKVMVLGAAAHSAAEKLVGSDGHPVLNKDPQNDSLMRFNGTPVLRSDYFEAFGVSKIIGTVFSLLGLRIRDVTQQNLARYVNVPDRPNQTGLNLFAYHAYGWAPSAVAKFKSAAA